MAGGWDVGDGGGSGSATRVNGRGGEARAQGMKI